MKILHLPRQHSSSRASSTYIIKLFLKHVLNSRILLFQILLIGRCVWTTDAFVTSLTTTGGSPWLQGGRISSYHNPHFAFLQSRLKNKSTRLLSSSLISPTDMWGNIAILSAASSIALTLGDKTTVGRLLGPPVSGMAISFLLASIGVLPSGGSPGAKTLQEYSVSLATPLILLSADLRTSTRRKTRTSHDHSSSLRPMILSFTLAAISTLLASCIGVFICRQSFFYGSCSCEDGLKLAAALLAKNIGGGINYVAVCQTLQVSPSSVAAGLCVDNIMALIYFPLTSIMAAGRPDVAISNTNKGTITSNTVHEHTTVTAASTIDGGGITVASTSVALSFAAIFTWLGNRIAGPTASIPCATALTLLVSYILPSRMMEFLRPSANLIGTVLLYLFFATAGAPGISCMDATTSFLLSITTFLCTLYLIHGSLLLLFRRLVLLWRGYPQHGDEGCVSPQRLLVASSAAIGGPATAAALAQANGWSSLIVPSILVGNIGYAIATFLGLAFYAAFTEKGNLMTRMIGLLGKRRIR
jgi:uncharacterized membrane protein